MTLGGKLLTKTRKQIEGSYKQHAWSDDWQESIDIQFVGEITPAVSEAIIAAFYASKHAGKSESLFGRLRASNADRVSHVDVTSRQLIINCSVSICD
jgi:hypothetical protein